MYATYSRPMFSHPGLAAAFSCRQLISRFGRITVEGQESPARGLSRARLRAAMKRIDAGIEGFVKTPPGHVVFLLLATAAWLLFWAWFDVVVVVRAFPPSANTYYYWIATWDVLFPLASLLAFRGHAWLPISAQVLGGWEDILFYWIQGYSIFSGAPSAFYLQAGAVLAASVIVEVVSHRVSFDRVSKRRLYLFYAGVYLWWLGGIWIFANHHFPLFINLAILVYLVVVKLPGILALSGRTWPPLRRKKE